MKYTATALATLLLSLSYGAAQAQSSVQVYGVVDAGIVVESGGVGGANTYVTGGLNSGSRIGFKGTEELGNGMKAVFVIESGLRADTGASTQGGLTFGRQSYVGLSGGWGTVSMGRQYSAYYKALCDVADPFDDGLAGQAPNIMAAPRRIDNSVNFSSYRYAGWALDATYGAGEVAADSTRKRSLSVAVNYVQGPFAAVLAHHHREEAVLPTHTRNTLAAVRYTVGAYTGHLGYAQNSGPAGAESRDLVAGVSAAFGPHRMLASVVDHQDRNKANRDARQFGVGYMYALSKRTDLYTAYGHINNKNGAGFVVGNATDDGNTPTAFNLGMRHLF